VLVSIVMELLIMTACLAYAFAAHQLMELAVAAGMREAFAGVLSAVFFFILVGVTIFVVWRLARKPPTSSKGEGAG
jgi:hypothetical protein